MMCPLVSLSFFKSAEIWSPTGNLPWHNGPPLVAFVTKQGVRFSSMAENPVRRPLEQGEK